MGIKHGVANLLGMGKYAAIEKRNKELEETVLKEKQRLQKQFAAAVRQEVEKAVAPYEQQKNADRLLINALQSKVSVLSESNMELSSRNSRRVMGTGTLVHFLGSMNLSPMISIKIQMNLRTITA